MPGLASRSRIGRVAVAALTLAVATGPGGAEAAILTLPADLTVLGTDVFSGPSFTVSGSHTATDVFRLEVRGTVDLAGGRFTANAAGIIVAP